MSICLPQKGICGEVQEGATEMSKVPQLGTINMGVPHRTWHLWDLLTLTLHSQLHQLSKLHCVLCGLAGHASWERNCPTFQHKCGELNDRVEWKGCWKKQPRSDASTQWGMAAFTQIWQIGWPPSLLPPWHHRNYCHPFSAPKCLKLWQKNLNKSRSTQEDLINSDLWKDYDIILLQEL